MLLSFRVANHCSIRDEQQLLLTPYYDDGEQDDANRPAVPVAGIFGANGAGKSNVLGALAYMQSMVLWSQRDSEPGAGVDRHPFVLDRTAMGAPSRYVVDLDIAEVRYTYGFAVDDERVVDEWLYRYRKGHKSVVFERDGDEYRFGSRATDSIHSVREITDVNVLFLSVAARSRQPLVQPVYSWFASAISQRPGAHRRRNVSPALLGKLEDDAFRERMTEMVSSADTGISSVELVEQTIDLPNSTSRNVTGVLEGIRRGLPVEARGRKIVVFAHSGADPGSLLTLNEESEGTQTLFHLGFRVLETLDQGGLIAVDELDSSLHPYLSSQLIRLFRSKESNPLGAQLVFTSHDAALLGKLEGREVLARDSIWFVEKDDAGVTELFPLTEFKPRKSEENRERRYLVGRYGAVPVIRDDLFAAALAKRAVGTNEDTPDAEG